MPRAGLTIFIIFFGLATLEAITDGRWLRIAFWLTLAGIFALLDWWGHRRHVTPE
jgi:Flp pilus assembly protein protease CpaA